MVDFLLMAELGKVLARMLAFFKSNFLRTGFIFLHRIKSLTTGCDKARFS